MWFRQILNFRVKDLKFSIFVKIFIKFVQFWSKIEILWSRVKDLKFWFSLGLRISNFTNLPKSKFSQNHQILSKKFLISQILTWVLGLTRSHSSPGKPKIITATFPRKSCCSPSILTRPISTKSKFEILNPSTPNLDFDTILKIFVIKILKFEENYPEIDKIGDDPKLDP